MMARHDTALFCALKSRAASWPNMTKNSSLRRFPSKTWWDNLYISDPFRFELAQAKSKVIVVVKGELPNDNEMPPAIQAYIKAHTYIHTDDGWFWKKLRYALPHKGKRPELRLLPRFLQRHHRQASHGAAASNDRFQLLNGSFNNSTISLQQSDNNTADYDGSGSVGFSNIMGSNNVKHNSVSPMPTTTWAGDFGYRIQ